MQNTLQVTCDKCKVAETCPKKGSSPAIFPHLNKRKLFCHIIGGYGRVPVRESLLSEESKEKSKVNGPCLTIAHVPTYDESTGMLTDEVVKIFSKPIKHPRETIPWNINLFFPKGGAG
jgi:hypothetical protein